MINSNVSTPGSLNPVPAVRIITTIRKNLPRYISEIQEWESLAKTRKLTKSEKVQYGCATRLAARCEVIIASYTAFVGLA